MDEEENKKVEINDDNSRHGFTLLDIIGIIFVVVLLLAFTR